MSWYTYKMIDCDPPTDLTASSIIKSMKLFEKYFEVKVNAIGHPTLLVWEMVLEEKQRQIKTRSSDVQNIKVPAIRKYTCALSVEDELLFTNRVLIKQVRTTMVKALHCKKFDALNLSNSIPSNLLMLYNQSNEQNPAALQLQYQDKMLDSMEQLQSGIPLSKSVEGLSDKNKETYLQLGTNPKKIPQIKKVTVKVDNVPLKSKNPTLKGFRFQDMNFELAAPSVFHFYLNLAEQGFIKEIPQWLRKMRARGQTDVAAHYS